MKKIICFILCTLLIIPALAPAGAAVSIYEGMDAMVAEFRDGASALDYVYYSPLKTDTDTTKYPLVVWLHGNASGEYKGHQCRNSCIYNWVSSEYQARFTGTGGAYLLLPRCPTGTIPAWGEDKMMPLKLTIDTFIEENREHIDTSRIYIGGYSLGGKMCILLAAAYPDFFAACFPMSPVYEPTLLQLGSLGNMPVWLFVNRKDEYITLDYNTVVKPRWDFFRQHAVAPERCRITVFENFWYAEGVLNTEDVHNTWDAVTYDMFMKSGEVYYDSATRDGLDNPVSLSYPNGVISWLSQQSIPESANPIFAFINRLIEFFKAFIQKLGI